MAEIQKLRCNIGVTVMEANKCACAHTVTDSNFEINDTQFESPNIPIAFIYLLGYGCNSRTTLQ